MDSSGGFRPARSCNTCRKRKSKCILQSETSEICMLCQFYGYTCTFDQPINKRKSSSSPNDTTINVLANSSGFLHTDESTVLGAKRVAGAGTDGKPRKAMRKTARGAAKPAGPDRSEVVALPDYNVLVNSRLYQTLGLQCTRFISYIGQSSELDPVLLTRYQYDGDNNTTPFTEDETMIREIRRIRQYDRFESGDINPDSSEAFMLTEERQRTPTGGPGESGILQLAPEVVAETKKVLGTVGTNGPKLLRLFLRIVHPCFPMMHKTTLMDKYERSVYELSPSIHSALIVFSLRWWAYDKDIALTPLPDPAALLEMGLSYYNAELHKPTISTVQAGLLLLQHQIMTDDFLHPRASWSSMAALLAATQTVGLHLDPTYWQIPQWEKSLRKRLGWSIFMQEKWTALSFGRPSLIMDDDWIVPDIDYETDFNDFDPLAQEAINKGEFVNPETGKMLFMEMITLSKFLSEILRELYSTRKSAEFMEVYSSEVLNKLIVENMEVVRGFQLRLREWYHSVPECLQMNAVYRGELSANSNVHISFFAVEMTLFKPLVKLLAKTRTQYQEVKAHVHMVSFDLLSSAIEIITNLRAQDLQVFWYSSTKSALSLIVSFGFILFLSVDSYEIKRKCLDRLDELRWSLALNSTAAKFMMHAISWIDHCYLKLKVEVEEVRGSTGSFVPHPDADHQPPLTMPQPQNMTQPQSMSQSQSQNQTQLQAQVHTQVLPQMGLKPEDQRDMLTELDHHNLVQMLPKQMLSDTN